MNLKKILCLALALMLFAFAAVAETEDLQTELDAANARIEELEAQVELYKPYYDKEIAVEYDGGIITVDEAMKVYEQYASMYSQYGIDLAAYGMEDSVKQNAVDEVMTRMVVRKKAEELGILPLDEAAKAELEEEVENSIASAEQGYISYYYADQEVTDEMRGQIRKEMEAYGYSHDQMYADMENNFIDEQIYNETIKDVDVTEDDIKAAYDKLVEEAKTNYETESTYVNDVNSGNTVVYHPEGYRMIKQVLIKFDDDQSAKYSELSSTLKSLNDEMTAATAPAEEAADETAEEATEEAATEEAIEEEAPARAVEEIQKDIDACNADLEALYEALMPEVNEVVDAFNNGTDIETLITEHNDDKGMPEAGYPVKANSTMWDPAFADAAMAIAEKGQIGEPARGSYGIYITYYSDDVVSGAVDYDTVHEYVATTALSDKQKETYNTALTGWTKALNPVYHYENLK